MAEIIATSESVAEPFFARTRARLDLAAPLGRRLTMSALIMLALALCSTETWMWGLLAGYAVGVALITYWSHWSSIPGRIPQLHLSTEVALLTVALAALDALTSPLLVLYAAPIAFAAFAGGKIYARTIALIVALLYASALVWSASSRWLLGEMGPANLALAVGGNPLLFGSLLTLVLGIAADRSFRKIHRRAMRAEGFYRQLFMAAHEPIVIWHPSSFAILDLNPAALELTRLPREALVGRSLAEIFPALEGQEARDLLSEWDAAPHLQTFHRYFSPEGDERLLLATPTLLEGRRAAVSVLKDLTDEIRRMHERRRHAMMLESAVSERTRDLQRVNERLREVSRKLLDAQHLSTLESLTGALANSINNPLQALLGTVQLQIEGRIDRDPALERILMLAKRIQRVVHSTLDLVRRGSMELSRESPIEIVETLAADISKRAKDRHVDVVIEHASELPAIRVDRARFLAALDGIAENALDAMPHGGTVVLGVEAVDGVDAVRFSICDSGPGIPAELRQKCMEAFFTTKGGGAGLGLTIANGIVQGHKGTLRIDAPELRGARISVEVESEPPPRAADDDFDVRSTSAPT